MVIDDQRSEEIANPWSLDEESSDDYESKQESRSQIGHHNEAGKLLKTMTPDLISYNTNEQKPNVLFLD